MADVDFESQIYEFSPKDNWEMFSPIKEVVKRLSAGYESPFKTVCAWRTEKLAWIDSKYTKTDFRTILFRNGTILKASKNKLTLQISKSTLFMYVQILLVLS